MNGDLRLELGSGFHLTPMREGDQPALVEHLRDRATTDLLLKVPHPYAIDDANRWVRFCLEGQRGQPSPSNFAVRRMDGRLIGGIGLQLQSGFARHRGELGYWLARPYRGRGLATYAVQTIVAYGFACLGLRRIEATSFAHNVASHRVLEKAGFQREGLLNGYHLKGEALLDAVMFAIVALPAGG
jgi:RimJ/RimL family protein N-acetyltransferase